MRLEVLKGYLESHQDKINPAFKGKLTEAEITKARKIETPKPEISGNPQLLISGFRAFGIS
jgi:hypothetical protein